MAEEKQGEGKLIEEARKAYGIDKKYVFAAREYPDRAVIVTAGGCKVVYRPGQEVKRLSPAQLGVQPPKPKAEGKQQAAGS